MNIMDLVLKIRSLNESEIDKFIEERINYLESTAVEDRKVINASSIVKSDNSNIKCKGIYGFVPKSTSVCPLEILPLGLVVDDDSIYKKLIELIRGIGDEEISSHPRFSYELLNLVFDVIQDYYGEFCNGSLRQELYLTAWDNYEDTISIRDFKGKGTAVCVERSLLGQNLLSFLGFNSLFIYDKLSVEGQKMNDLHAFNCIMGRRNSTGKGVLVDFTQYHHDNTPRIINLDEGQFLNLISNNNFVLEATDYMVYSSYHLEDDYFEKMNKSKG